MEQLGIKRTTDWAIISHTQQNDGKFAFQKEGWRAQVFFFKKIDNIFGKLFFSAESLKRHVADVRGHMLQQSHPGRVVKIISLFQ